MRIGAREYRFTIASDLQRDGMALEVDDVTDGQPLPVLEVFYADADGEMTVTAWQPDLPVALVEESLAFARRRLPDPTRPTGSIG